MPEFVDVDHIETMLSGSIDSALIEEYYHFGTFLLSEVQATTSAIDSKLLATLGLAGGLLVSLLFGSTLGHFAVSRLLVSLAAASVLFGLSFAAWALWARGWRVPSEQDWFLEGLRDAETLKKYHLVSLLASHHQHAKLAELKGMLLRRAQFCVVVSVGLVAIALIIASVS
jgi:hypothetical protein